ncbi:MAG: YggT family protein [Eggerthellales bacterium]|nr:YggT family protein [Eggerthellales bacterium]
MLSLFIYYAGNIYTWLIFGYCILTWFPVSSGVIADLRRALEKIVDPFLGIFRKFIPPIGGMVDISPIVALFVLQFIVRILIFIL